MTSVPDVNRSSQASGTKTEQQLANNRRRQAAEKIQEELSRERRALTNFEEAEKNLRSTLNVLPLSNEQRKALEGLLRQAGLLIRVYSKKPELLSSRIERVNQLSLVINSATALLKNESLSADTLDFLNQEIASYSIQDHRLNRIALGILSLVLGIALIFYLAPIIIAVGSIQAIALGVMAVLAGCICLGFSVYESFFAGPASVSSELKEVAGQFPFPEASVSPEGGESSLVEDSDRPTTSLAAGI